MCLKWDSIKGKWIFFIRTTFYFLLITLPPTYLLGKFYYDRPNVLSVSEVLGCMLASVLVIFITELDFESIEKFRI